MATLQLLDQTGTHARYVVRDDRGAEIRQVDRDVADELAAARNQGVPLEVVLAQLENAAVAESLPAVIQATVPLTVAAHTHPPELVPHDHAALDEKIGTLATALTTLAAKVDELFIRHAQEGHAGYAPTGHLHDHLEDAFLHANEGTGRVALEVAHLREEQRGHTHTLQQHEHTLPTHEHETPLVLTERLVAAENLITELRTRLRTLEAIPTAAFEHEHPVAEHHHDEYELFGHSHELIPHDHPQPPRPIPAQALTTSTAVGDHEHVFNVLTGDGLGWRCSICGELKGP